MVHNLFSFPGKQGNALTVISERKIRRKIVEHLSRRINKQDTLNGIVMGVFEHEFKDFSENIVKNIGLLIKKGIIEESINEHNNQLYKLSIN